MDGRRLAAVDQYPAQAGVGPAGLLALVSDSDQLAGEVQRIDQGFVSAQRPVGFEQVMTGEMHVLVVDDDGRT